MPARKIEAGVTIGVMGLDLGGTSGVAMWKGELMDRKHSLSECLNGGELVGHQIACGGTVNGERDGALEIRNLWLDWDEDDVDSWLVIEDFMLRPSGIGSTDRVGLSSARLAALVEGVLVEYVARDRIARYAPSMSKPFATSDRLKLWGLWVVGMPHARDASKQVALHIAKLRERL